MAGREGGDRGEWGRRILLIVFTSNDWYIISSGTVADGSAPIVADF